MVLLRTSEAPPRTTSISPSRLAGLYYSCPATGRAVALTEEKLTHSSTFEAVKARSRLFVLAAVVVLAASCSKRPEATDTDARFQGQILRIVVGRSPGGTYDLYARAMAQYFGRHVPGHPTVVVENMPGAGGLLALKYLARQARPDGLTIGQVGLPGTLAQVTDDPETQADAAQFHALGSPADDVPVCVFSRASRIDFTAWRAGSIRPRLGVTSYGTSSQINTALMTAALQLPAQIV